MIWKFADRSPLLKRQLAVGETLAVLGAVFSFSRAMCKNPTALAADGYLAKRGSSQPVET